MNMQLPLGISLKDSATFKNFYLENDALLLATLGECAQGGEEGLIYLWGSQGTGKTHLMQAACHHAADHQLTSSYLPLAEMMEYPTDVLEGMENLSLVCLDDLEVIAGKQDWEVAIFSLFNRIREQQGHLIVAASASPDGIGLQLPDLVSRLKWGPVFHLQPLSDEGKLSALQLRARARGFDLPDDAGRYLLRHFVRDMHALFRLLDDLDEASLVEQRKLTVPFIRKVMQGKG
jgi:DnaA family protein